MFVHMFEMFYLKPESYTLYYYSNFVFLTERGLFFEVRSYVCVFLLKVKNREQHFPEKKGINWMQVYIV